jgi:hypothetical protein
LCVCSGQVLAATQGRTVAIALGSDVVEQGAVKMTSRDSDKATGYSSLRQASYAVGTGVLFPG